MSVNRYDKNKARKLSLELCKKSKIVFSGHALKELKNDDLDRMDAINVIMSPSAKISKEPEYANGSWRYRIETKNICVVITFVEKPSGIIVVTVFKIERK